MTIVLRNCAVVTMDGARNEYTSGHVVVDGNRIASVGDGPGPVVADATVVDASGCLATPGLVNTHHHLYQWLTRGLAPDAALFDWLTTLYPLWARIDVDLVNLAASAGLARLARSGCSTSADHHYVFPQGSGDVFAAVIAAAQEVGLRFHACRGSMDLGRSAGGLPPDHIVEDRDAILAASERAIEEWHDVSFDAMVRVALAPCSPFSVTGELMRESADLARSKHVRLHTHLAETLDEEDFCRERFGCLPLDYVESLGWSGPDVWYAHGVHFDDTAVKRLGAAHAAVAHCPTSNARLGAGIARAAELRAAGATVGLGVDGAASSEASSVLEEARHAVLFARARGGPGAMTVREALEMATMGGAAALGRTEEIGSLEVGKLADVALWRLDTPSHAGITDPVAALLLGSPPPLKLLLVNGRTVVQDDVVRTVDEYALGARTAVAHRKLVAS
jgi:cytosine/adenosine deaminase-related metal-dependent hydrolase